MWNKLKNIIKKDSTIRCWLVALRCAWQRLLCRLVADEPYVRWQYRSIVGKELNLKDPRSFNEKIIWLKLFWRDPRLSLCADKYAVRDYVKERIGSHVLTRLYGAYERVEDIDLTKLPDSFVLKVAHGSGQNIICPDKSVVDWGNAFSLLKIYLGHNYYNYAREYAYKNIPARVICEEFLSDNGASPADYKVYCCGGVPQFVEVHFDRFEDHKFNLYDLQWNLLEVGVEFQKKAVLPKPDFIDEMCAYSAQLSEGLVFVRVDWYHLNGRTYFGEMTFYPSGGYDLDVDSTSTLFGDRIKLPEGAI